MSVAEADSYIDGLRKRPRDMYESTRMICQVVHKVLTGKIMQLEFDWDNQSREFDEDDIEAAMEEARMMEEWMKQRLNNGKN